MSLFKNIWGSILLYFTWIHFLIYAWENKPLCVDTATKNGIQLLAVWRMIEKFAFTTDGVDTFSEMKMITYTSVVLSATVVWLFRGYTAWCGFTWHVLFCGQLWSTNGELGFACSVNAMMTFLYPLLTCYVWGLTFLVVVECSDSISAL